MIVDLFAGGGRAYFNRFQFGTSHPNAKMDAEKVRTIRSMAGDGASLAVIGLAFGIHPSTVHAIVRWKTWRHVA